MNKLAKPKRFLSFLDPGRLAIALLVALALLGTLRGNDFQTGNAGVRNEGYLQVYSATDQFDDGGALYYAHSAYAIYTVDGKLLKTVENHISRSDEIPERVSLASGSYLVEARSTDEGYVRVRVVIAAGRLTIIDLDSSEKPAPARLVFIRLVPGSDRSDPRLWAGRSSHRTAI